MTRISPRPTTNVPPLSTGQNPAMPRDAAPSRAPSSVLRTAAAPVLAVRVSRGWTMPTEAASLPELRARLSEKIDRLYFLSLEQGLASSWQSTLDEASRKLQSGEMPSFSVHAWEFLHRRLGEAEVELFPFAAAPAGRVLEAEELRRVAELAARLLKESPTLPEFLRRFFANRGELWNLERQARLFAKALGGAQTIQPNREFHRAAYGLLWFGDALAWRDYFKENLLRGKPNIAPYEATKQALRDQSSLEALWGLGAWHPMDLDFWREATEALAGYRKVEVVVTETPVEEASPSPKLVMGDIGPLPPKLPREKKKVEEAKPKPMPTTLTEAAESLRDLYRDFCGGDGDAYSVWMMMFHCYPLLFPERWSQLAAKGETMYRIREIDPELRARFCALMGIEDLQSFLDLQWSAMVEYHILPYHERKTRAALLEMQNLCRKLQDLPSSDWDSRDLHRLVFWFVDFVNRLDHKVFPEIPSLVDDSAGRLRCFNYLFHIFRVPYRLPEDLYQRILDSGRGYFDEAFLKAELKRHQQSLVRYIQEEKKGTPSQAPEVQILLLRLQRFVTVDISPGQAVAVDELGAAISEDYCFMFPGREYLRTWLALRGDFNQLFEAVLFEQKKQLTVAAQSARPELAKLVPIPTRDIRQLFAAVASLLLQKGNPPLEEAVASLATEPLSSAEMRDVFASLEGDYLLRPRSLEELQKLGRRLGLLGGKR